MRIGPNTLYRRLGKPILDRAAAGIGLVVLSPVLAITAATVAIRLGRPVLFRQIRPGKGGRLFEIVKFRTMTDARGPDGKLLPDAHRLTPFGRFLRSSSLDELPELWNVLRGEMSFVGPRPLLPDYLPHFTSTQARRHEVRPGITGWAQTRGRNDTTWEARLNDDVYYVDHASFSLDLKILLRTFATVMGRKGVTAKGHPTMPRFDGADQDRASQ